MKERTCCFTGHREISEDVAQLYQKLLCAIQTKVEEGYDNFISGAARGFDTMAARAVLELRSQYQIRLILALPCPDQAKGWMPADQKLYQSICGEADEVRLVADHYFRGCMHLRNRYMVEHSTACICYCRKATGGTAYTRAISVKKGLSMIDL